jgi:formate-dependent nitrite reductase cytochrome c552 subunit
MPVDSRPFVVARNKRIVPKQRRIERLPSGYSIREFYNHPQGHYWYVVTALEVIPTKTQK